MKNQNCGKYVKPKIHEKRESRMMLGRYRHCIDNYFEPIRFAKHRKILEDGHLPGAAWRGLRFGLFAVDVERVCGYRLLGVLKRFVYAGDLWSLQLQAVALAAKNRDFGQPAKPGDA